MRHSYVYQMTDGGVFTSHENLTRKQRRNCQAIINKYLIHITAICNIFDVMVFYYEGIYFSIGKWPFDRCMRIFFGSLVSNVTKPLLIRPYGANYQRRLMLKNYIEDHLKDVWNFSSVSLSFHCIHFSYNGE